MDEGKTIQVGGKQKNFAHLNSLSPMLTIWLGGGPPVEMKSHERKAWESSYGL
jgi:hypothetical protein